MQIYYVQSSSGLVVKLGPLLEWHSSWYNKASIKRTEIEQRKIPTPPITLPTRYTTFASHRPTLPSLA